MNQINEIRAQLRPHRGWHGARLSFVALFLVALFRAKTVNLAELATGFLTKGFFTLYIVFIKEIQALQIVYFLK